MGNKRVLAYLSYIGTHYKGLQRQLASHDSADLDTVQGILEYGLGKVLRTKPISIYVSSRTDTGVHAVLTSVQFDLNVDQLLYFGPDRLCQSLNSFLEKNKTQIRINRLVEVPEDFNCRRALKRTYCYRIALYGKQGLRNCIGLNKSSAALPLLQRNTCTLVGQPFDTEIVSDLCKYFLGTWNFSTFMVTDREAKSKQPKDFVKTIYNFSFGKLPDCVKGNLDPLSNDIDYYDFHIIGSGFLRRQVRRMVGTLISAGSGQINAQDVLYMLRNPSPKNWNSRVQSASAHGLFLKSIEYYNEDILRGYLS